MQETDKYYTIEERSNLLKDSFYNEDTQEKFREYRDYVLELLSTKGKLTAQDGFNHCLKMIEVATDINWEEVKWKGLYSSMVSWFSALDSHDRKANKD